MPGMFLDRPSAIRLIHQRRFGKPGKYISQPIRRRSQLPVYFGILIRAEAKCKTSVEPFFHGPNLAHSVHPEMTDLLPGPGTAESEKTRGKRRGIGVIKITLAIYPKAGSALFNYNADMIGFIGLQQMRSIQILVDHRLLSIAEVFSEPRCFVRIAPHAHIIQPQTVAGLESAITPERIVTMRIGRHPK